MAVYTMADLHLSLGADKSMDIFPGWEGYVQRIQRHWQKLISPEDTILVGGDISWGMTLEQSLPDFRFIEALPGQKYLLKGNHDYWWTTKSKMERFFAEHGLGTLHIIHNNCAVAEGKALCGTRGWMFEAGQPHDQKIVQREAQRLAASLASAPEGVEKIAFLHYPPVYLGQTIPEFLRIMQEHGVRRCYYGHLHGAACKSAFQGEYEGITMRLVSGDHLGFRPVFIE